MTITPERVETLRGFRLSEYGARAYLALLELGTTEARDVSRLAKVPIAKIYSTLEQLQERGLVEVLPGLPKRFAPVPFADFLRRRRDAHHEEIRRLDEKTPHLAELFAIRGGVGVNDRGGVLALRGRVNVAEKLRGMIAAAERDVLLVLTERATLARALVPALEEAHARGVVVRVLARAFPEGSELAPLEAFAARRIRPPTQGSEGHVGFLTVDGVRLAIAHFLPDDASAQGKDVAFLLDESAIAAALHAVLARYWESGAPADERAAAPAPSRPV